MQCQLKQNDLFSNKKEHQVGMCQVLGVPPIGYLMAPSGGIPKTGGFNNKIAVFGCAFELF